MLNVMEEGSVTKVLNDFLTLSEGEISLEKGEIVQVLEKVDRHWWYGYCSGKYGKFPATHLILMDTPPLEDSHELFATIADFPRQQDGDLSFKKGELIIGISQVNENWWYGKINERTGIFPTTYTWQLDSKPLKVKSKRQIMNLRARVKMSMKAQLDEEMDLDQDDIVIVTEVIDKNWYRGICGTREGVFPSAYVEILDSVNLVGESESFDRSEFKSSVLLPGSSCSDSRPKSNDDIDSLLALSPEAQFPPSTEVTVNDSDVFNDNYFKVNMPSVYRCESVNKTNENEMHNAQSLELDIVPYGITLYPFYAQFDNELSFHEGEIVTFFRHIGKDWIEGKIDGRKGIFPKSYVNILVDCDNYMGAAEDLRYDSFNTVEEFSHDVAPNLFAKVLYNFDAQMNSDLTVHKDEVVWIMRKVNEDWCEVRNRAGKVGLCPQNYLTPHLLPDEEKCKLLRGTSLATDHLLGLFSTAEEATNINTADSEYVPSEICKRKYQSHDFSQLGTLSSQKKSDIEDFMSKNLEAYNVIAHTSHLLPHHRHSVEFSESRTSDFTSGNADVGKLSISSKLEQEESSSTTKFMKSSESVQLDHTSLAQLPKLLHSEDSKDRSRSTYEEEAVVLRSHPTVTLPQANCSHFRRQELSRQSSDRLPHRPAPPVPVPGQKPVRRSLHRITIETPEFAECKLPEEKALTEKHVEDENGLQVHEDLRKKNAEQRQNVITELVLTEKEYVRDLKITYETFNLHNPRHLESRGIDVVVVFGNILEVMQVAEELLDKLQLAMKGKNEDEQCVGQCFLELADQMKFVYGQYCMNHNNALMLLEKYESVEEIQNLFKKGIETLRLQVTCFDMGSILIKPVQRILKYPLILNELIKCTEDSHSDKAELLNSVKTMMEVATYINEHKRRKDIVSKYLDDGNTTISSRMSKISLHSVAKKSTRFGVMLTSTLFGVATKDPVFDEHEFMFHTVEKTVRNFLKNVEIFLCGMHEKVTYQQHVGSSVDQFYQENISEVEEFHRLQQIICKRFWVEFRKVVEQRVLFPLNTLIDLFEGPAILVQKRHDKLLDYDGCCAKAEKNKENRLIQEELLATKSNYEALNNHLLEELPTLNSLACEVLVECLAAFITTRKMLSGKITKEYLALMESPFMKSSQGDAIESFAVKHSLAWNQLGRFSFSAKNVKNESLTKRNSKSSPTLPTKQMGSESLVRSNIPSQQVYLKSRYPKDVLYCTVQPHTSVEPLELTVGRGIIVAAIKKHNPLGDARMWFVDDGSTKGFIPSICLEPLYQSSHTASPTNVPSQCSVVVPSPEEVQNIDHRKSRIWVNSPVSRLMEPPPPSYEEVVSSADSSPRGECLRISNASEHEYQVGENVKGSHVCEEISELDTSSFYENIPSNGDTSSSGFFYAAYDFEGNGTNMLSITSGQVVFVVKHQDEHGNPEWWFVEDRFGRKGYVPGNFLKKYQQ